MTKKIALLMIATALVSGCSAFKGKTKTTPVLGERTAVLVSEADVSIDPATAAQPMGLPAAEVNADWALEGGNAAKTPGHPALGATVHEVWSQSVGRGTTLTARLAGGPVIGGGKVYVEDTTATVRAFDAKTGASAWSTQFGTEKGNDASLFGGGVAYDNGTVYAVNGLGFAAALDAGNGGLRWTVRPGGPLRGTPTVDGGTIYTLSQDNQIFALSTDNGATKWTNAAALEVAGVFGTASPSVSRGTVVAGFSSGELNAYRVENGRQVWQDALSRTAISTSVATLSDIDAGAVIDDGVVYSIGKGGRMVAIDLNTGQRQWEMNLAGISTPWVAGNWLFAVTDEAKVIALDKTNGKVRWINQLPHWNNEKARKGLISYVGPVLAGGRLWIAGSNGALINIDPDKGEFLGQTALKSGVRVPMAVAGETLYVLDDSGRLHAFR